MASVDFEIDHDAAKAMRASHRANDLHMKRQEYARTRDNRDWHWGRAVEEAKPHRNARVAVRTCLAKGAVEAQEDMPSIVRMHTWKHEQAGKAPHRKPAIAHIVTYKNDVDPKAVGTPSHVDEVETTADEGRNGFEVESPGWTPEYAPQAPPLELASEVAAWPALAGALPEASAVAVAADKISHKEVALRFVAERIDEEAALAQRRAKKAKVLRAAREAGAWKTSLRRRRQRMLAAKKARARGGTAEAPQAHEGPAPAAASDDFEGVDRDTLKMMRASHRAHDLSMKRREYARARDARDWHWGRAVEEANPHRTARAAARTCLARGAVEAQEDMPSIVCMTSKGRHERAGKAPQRKPTVAPMVHYKMNPDTDEIDAAADEGDNGFGMEPAREAPANGPKDHSKELASEQEFWPALQRSMKEAATAKNQKKGSCVIA